MTVPAIYLLSSTVAEGVISLPMIGFESVAKSLDLAGCDTLLFTSKQAVRSADAIDKRWREYPSIAVGKATAREIEECGGLILYHSATAYAAHVAETLVDAFSERSILYLRPKEVSFDMRSFLVAQGMSLQEQILYKTSCQSYEREKRPPKGSIIIFTSPSTIRCFFQSFVWDESYRAVVIGEVTKRELAPEIEVYVADEPFITACIQKAHSLIAGV